MNSAPDKISWQTLCIYLKNEYDTPIPTFGSGTCVLVVKPAMGLELQFRDEQSYSTDVTKLPSLSRFAYGKSKTATYNYLAIRCEIPELTEAVLDFFYSIAHNRVVNRLPAEKALAKSYEQYKAILSRPLAPSEYTLKGLWGELYVLNKAAENPKLNASSLVYNWTGPEDQPNDFSFGTTAIEIKTTSKQKNVVEISSFDQLDASRCWLVILHAYHADSQNGGISIEELKASISDKVDSAAQAVLENRIDKVISSLSSPLSMKFSMQISGSPIVVSMSDAIPLLHRTFFRTIFGENKARLIENGKYVLDLSSVEYSLQTISDIFLEAQFGEVDND